MRALNSNWIQQKLRSEISVLLYHLMLVDAIYTLKYNAKIYCMLSYLNCPTVK